MDTGREGGEPARDRGRQEDKNREGERMRQNKGNQMRDEAQQRVNKRTVYEKEAKKQQNTIDRVLTGGTQLIYFLDSCLQFH